MHLFVYICVIHPVSYNLMGIRISAVPVRQQQIYRYIYIYMCCSPSCGDVPISVRSYIYIGAAPCTCTYTYVHYGMILYVQICYLTTLPICVYCKRPIMMYMYAYIIYTCRFTLHTCAVSSYMHPIGSRVTVYTGVYISTVAYNCMYTRSIHMYMYSNRATAYTCVYMWTHWEG